MPRIRAYKHKYMVKDLPVFIKGKLYETKKHQKDLAEAIGTSESNFTKKMNNCSFDYSDMITIFRVLEATDSEILQVMKEEK